MLAYRTGPLLVAANLTAGPAKLPAGAGEMVLATAAAANTDGSALGPWQGIVARATG